MKKLFKNKKGFAMAELLAVSIVLLFISSILFSNYLPLVAEYENRLSYNDVTAQYAAHYIRKMYMDALEDKAEIVVDGTTTTKGDKLKDTISLGMKSKGYYTVYSGNSDGKIFEQVYDPADCLKIIEQYEIEEIIITNYKLKDDTDTDTTYVKDGYAKNDGNLYNYIHYLPNYEKSIYTGKNEESGDQLYRVILKTKYFGYATTPILSDYKTPGSCFLGKQNADNNLTITDYLYDGNECGEDVIIGKGSIEIKSAEDPSKGIKGIVVAIGDEAFKNNGNISTIQLTNKVTSIGKNAFEGSGLIGEAPDLRYVTTIGERAFANTKITKVTLSGSRTIGDEAFADNHFLSTVDINGISDDIYSDENKTLTTGLFAKSGDKGSGISVIIPDGMTTVGEKMFYLAKINEINLGANVKTISDFAFSQWNGNSPTGCSIDSLIIPDSVEKIGISSFDYLKINSVYFGVKLLEIGDYAFRNSQIITLDFSKSDGLETIGASAFTVNQIQDVKIPDSVVTIKNSAFSKNYNLKEVTLPENLNYNTISNLLFYGCGNLSKIEIPDSVERILDDAFNVGDASGASGNKLEDVKINKSSRLKIIGGSAFFGQKNLKSFYIPEGVTNIFNNAFGGCENLTQISNYSSVDFTKRGCYIFYVNDNFSTCTAELEGNNIYLNNTGKSEKIITNMGGVTNEQ